MYLENLFVCRKNYKNGQTTCIGGNGTWQGAMDAHAMSVDTMWHRSMAPPPYHVTDPWDGLLTASLALIHGGLIQRCTLSCLGSMGPLSYTWRTKIDLQTTSLAGKPTYLPCNRLQGPTIIIGWQGGGMDGQPTPLGIVRWPSHPKPPHLRL